MQRSEHKHPKPSEDKQLEVETITPDTDNVRPDTKTAPKETIKEYQEKAQKKKSSSADQDSKSSG